MIIELINTGSELMLGRVLNSHQQWLCRELSNSGYLVTRQTAVPDDVSLIESAVAQALARAEIVIVTGGLGPTSDDLTRPTVAKLLGRKLREDSGSLAQIRAFFESRGRAMPEGARLEALAPEGAIVLPNPHGTAPGLAICLKPNPFRNDGRATWIILLPGPGRELRPMFSESVAPLLKREMPVSTPLFCRTLRSVGLGESAVQEKIRRSLITFVNGGGEVGYCARPGQVDVRLVSRGEHAREHLDRAEQGVRRLLGPDLFGTDNEELEEVVVRLLAERGQTLALAESCTGGCIAHRLTNVPGASAVLGTGWVTYSNEAKRDCLGVRPETLERCGAVSESVASEMAAGALQKSHSDYSLAVTGIAGPGGGTPAKPVGTVFLALASPRGISVRRMFNPWDRLTFKEVTTMQALNQLRLFLRKPARD